MGTNAKTAHTPYALAPAGSDEQGDVEEPIQTDVGEPPLPFVDELPLEPGQLPVTPISLTPDVGHAYGEPVLVGGTDLLASTATLVSYVSDHGPRTVLHARVDEDAEAKLLDALNVSPEMVPAQVEQQVTGRLPIDEQHNVAEKIITAAKSVNHHVANGTLTATGATPGTTAAKIDAAETAIEGLAEDLGDASPVEQAMLDHYAAQFQAVQHAVSSGTPVDHVTPFLHDGTAVVTVMVPALPSEAFGGAAVAVLRDATRIKPTLDADTGQASWDGGRTTGVLGKEYAIDLGEGYQAVYRPYGVNDPAKSEYSLRGRLEIIAPAGEGHGPDVVRRLGQLNLANRPMTRDEGEYSYLAANVTAQRLGAHVEVAAAQVTGDVRQSSSLDSSPTLVWDQPDRLLARADYYGANADTFGVINPAKAGEYAKAPLTRNPFKIAKFSNACNEVMFADGIDLLGAEGPSRILCKNSAQRDEITALLHGKGVTSIAGKPIEEVVTLCSA